MWHPPRSKDGTTPVLDGPCAGQFVINCPAPLPYPLLTQPNRPHTYHPYTYDAARKAYVYDPNMAKNASQTD